MTAEPDARDFPSRDGTPGHATPAQAQRWLEEWAMLGGGVTITRDGRVNPWRLVVETGGAAATLAERLELAARLELDLLNELDKTPGLASAVRTVVGSRARLRFGRALKAMLERRRG